MARAVWRQSSSDFYEVRAKLKQNYFEENITLSDRNRVWFGKKMNK